MNVDGHDTRPYPWQAKLWQELGGLQQRDCLPHAMLFCGAPGLGKWALVRLLARRLLCELPDAFHRPCSGCRSCRLFLGGQHPDSHEVVARGKQNTILVDQIRDLIEFVALTSQHGGQKIAYIQHAERMNPNAANSFLKTLEEPPADTLLLLASDAPQRLPATIRSRCRLLRIAKPDRQVGLRWLAEQGIDKNGELLLDLANDAPLAARALADSGMLARRQAQFEQFVSLLRGGQEPLGLAADWHKQDSGEILRHLDGWTQDLLRLGTAQTQSVIRNRDFGPELDSLARRLPTAAVFRLLRRTREMLEMCDTSASPQLSLEDLLIEWTRVVRTRDPFEEK